MGLKKIAIIGAGGFGREVHKLIDVINTHQGKWNLLGFYDNGYKKGELINGLPILGSDNEALNQEEINNFAIAVGDPRALNRISSLLISAGKTLPNLVYPNIDLEPMFNQIGVGNIFTHGFYLTRNISIGDFNIFNTNVTLGHDVRIGSCNVFLPNVQVSGKVTIGNQNILGMNTGIYQGRAIGSRNTIGAHSFIITNFGDENHIFGVPAVLSNLRGK
jgi:sugar O-acyltransferase (sialic acid O-acetyltransferase NeuD family)